MSDPLNMSNLGLVLRRHSLYYGHEFGWLMWLPNWLKRGIVKIFNFITCRTMGHEILGPLDIDEDGIYDFEARCTNCSKRFPGFMDIEVIKRYK